MRWMLLAVLLGQAPTLDQMLGPPRPPPAPAPDPIVEQMKREREADPEAWRRQILEYRRQEDAAERRVWMRRALAFAVVLAGATALWFGRRLPSRIFRSGLARGAAVAWMAWFGWRLYAGPEHDSSRSQWDGSDAIWFVFTAVLIPGAGWLAARWIARGFQRPASKS